MQKLVWCVGEKSGAACVAGNQIIIYEKYNSNTPVRSE